MVTAVKWVQDSIGSSLKAVTERVVVALFVVISHITVVPWLAVDRDLGLCSLLFASTVEAPLGKVLREGCCLLTVGTLSDVDFGIEAAFWAVGRAVLAVVGPVVDVDLCVYVTLIGFSVPLLRRHVSQDRIKTKCKSQWHIACCRVNNASYMS